jgi:hypothetical protein
VARVESVGLHELDGAGLVAELVADPPALLPRENRQHVVALGQAVA